MFTPRKSFAQTHRNHAPPPVEPGVALQPRSSPSPGGFLAACLLLISVSNSFSIGMRHDVPENNYLALAQNRPPYLPGPAPDFSPVVAIGLAQEGSKFELIGSGVLIAPQWVLTAAHVVLSPDPSLDFQTNLVVRFGSGATKPTHERKVIDIDTPLPVLQLRPLLQSPGGNCPEAQVIHAEFHDLALICLDQPVADIPPAICDDTAVDLLNYFICIAGFGESAKGNNPIRGWWREPNLKHAAENVIDRVVTVDPLIKRNDGGILVFDFDNGQESRNTLNGSVSLWTTLFGTGISNRVPRRLEGAPYPGDSGGPAFAFLEDKWRVVGISGYGTGFPLNRKHASIVYGDVLVYTNVKAHSAWIKQLIRTPKQEPATPSKR